MKVIHVIIIIVIFVVTTVIGKYAVNSLPESKTENIKTIEDVKTIHTDKMIPARSKLTAENFEEKIVNVLGDDILIFLIKPTENLNIECDDIQQRVVVNEVINGDSYLEGKEIELCYVGFHSQSFEEFNLNQREGEPYLYYTNCCGILKPQKEYIVFCKSLTIGSETVYRAAYSSFPSFYHLTSDENEIKVLDKESNDFSEVYEYDIYVSNDEQVKNWEELKKYVLKNYYLF